jgi:hypothetical protein
MASSNAYSGGGPNVLVTKDRNQTAGFRLGEAGEGKIGFQAMLKYSYVTPND